VRRVSQLSGRGLITSNVQLPPERGRNLQADRESSRALMRRMTLVEVPAQKVAIATRARRSIRFTHGLVMIAVAAVAFSARLVPQKRGSGFYGLGNYDDGVYYAAATALVHVPGRGRPR
jgi:hypothetical protein